MNGPFVVRVVDNGHATINVAEGPVPATAARAPRRIREVAGL